MAYLVRSLTAKARAYGRRSTQGRRLLPGLIIVGAQKAGTSSLFAYLADHPQLLPSSPKEVHYFDLNFDRGPGWYRSHFPLARRSRVSGDGSGPSIGFEASPYYLPHPLAPYRIRGLLPSVKIVALLRNPVDRALSHYYHEVKHGRESLPLRDALSAEAGRVASDLRLLGEVPFHRSRYHQRYSYLGRGRYAEQLVVWKSLFPQEQILVLDSAELFESTAPCLERIFDFAGLSPIIPSRFDVVGSTEYPSEDLEIRSELETYFASHNERLWQMIGEDYGWNR